MELQQEIVVLSMIKLSIVEVNALMKINLREKDPKHQF